MAAKDRDALISVDPNCRPSMIQDPVQYRQGLERFFEEADLIKCSTRSQLSLSRLDSKRSNLLC